MATINSLTELTAPTRTDNAVIENATGTFREPARFTRVIDKDDIFNASNSSLTHKDVLIAFYNYIMGSDFNGCEGTYIFQHAWATHTNGIRVVMHLSYFNGAHPFAMGTLYGVDDGAIDFMVFTNDRVYLSASRTLTLQT